MSNKTTLKLKILSFLRDKIASTPEGKNVPKWLSWSAVFTVWLFNIPGKIRRAYSWLINLALIQLLANLWFVFITSKSEARVFSGFFYRWLAVRYAEKRSKISRVNKLFGGKRHFVIEYDTNSLIVINKTEINTLKSKHWFKKNYNITDALKNAFYVTKEKQLKKKVA